MKAIKSISLGHTITALAMLLALYLFVMLIIGIIASLEAYLLALFFGLTMTYVATEALSLLIQDVKDSAILKELKSIDGLNIAQRALLNLKQTK